MLSFLSILRAENYKTKRRFGLTISITLPVLLTALSGTYFYFGMRKIVVGYNPEFALSTILFSLYNFVYPLYAIVICFLIADIEHQARGFKYLFTLPVKKIHLYLSKVIIISVWLIISILTALVVFYLTTFILNKIYPDFHFEEYNSNNLVISYFLKLFVCCIALQAIHFSLSHFFKNFIKSVGIGIFLLMIGILISDWEKSYLFLYSHPFIYYKNFTKHIDFVFTSYFLSGIIYIIIFHIVGFYGFKRIRN